jgi:hypothetical protein
MTITRTEAAVKWAIKNGYIVHQHREYLVTDDGRNYCDAATKRPHFGSADGVKFKDEVLSGLAEVPGKLGKRTELTSISSAVLPTVSSVVRTSKTPEDLYHEEWRLARAEHEIAESLAIDIHEYRALQRQGRIKVCRGLSMSHVGIFDKRGDNGLQHLCRDCRRKQRAKA